VEPVGWLVGGVVLGWFGHQWFARASKSQDAEDAVQLGLVRIELARRGQWIAEQRDPSGRLTGVRLVEARPPEMSRADRSDEG
jgi:hypothetical protein